MAELPARMTIREKYDPAMKIMDQKEADEYFEKCVRHALSWNPDFTRGQAEQMERTNLGFYAGYYDHETRLRVEKLFHCQHPYFGKAGPEPVGAKEAYEAGVKVRNQLKEANARAH